MKGIVLIYDKQESETVEEVILPALGAEVKTKIPFNNVLNFDLEKDEFVVTYLSDEQLKELFPLALKNEWKIGLLPHPKLIHGRQGFGIGNDLEDSLEYILGKEETEEVDLLTINGRPVFNTVVIGESLSLVTGTLAQNGWQRFWKKLRYFFKLFRDVKVHGYTITAKEKEKLETAAIGMVIVQHGKSNLLSRRVLEDSYINDGKMHAMILAPKSITGLFWFGLDSFFRSSKKRGLPPFAAHIKTEYLKIESETPINYSQDGVLMSAQCLELEVSPKAIKIIPGKHLELGNKGSGEDVFKVKVLPRGEAREELLKINLPLIHHASTEEFKDLFSNLRAGAMASNNYLVLMVISTFIATLGLFGNSSPVIIGAMILAPLMAPVISLSMGVLRQDKKLILNSIKAIGLGMLLGYICAMLLTWLTPLNISNDEILARVRPNLLDLGIAVGSGVAGAYASAKEELAKTLAGVAIAVALVPPLAVSGIGLGWMEWDIFTGALLLLLTNLAGMVFAAALTFLLLGFSPFRLARKGIAYTLIIVGMISLPLFLGFMNMVREKDVISKLNGHRVEDVVLRDISVRSLKPIHLAIKIIAEGNLEEEQIRAVKKEIEMILGEEVELEITVGMKIL
ncbi:MAG: TIGR00341 family protein [Cyclobacteriaceae bacterium]